MAAQNTDKLRKVARKWVGQVGAGGVENGTVTTVPLASTANLPTETAIMITIDRVDANGVLTPDKEEGIIGVVSGDNLISCLRGVEGTAQAHSAGAVVEVLWTARNVNDIVDAILAEHSQSGAHTTNQINEKTEDAGVTVDGLLIKDSGPTGWDGWMIANETWTYASADDPTFTITVPSGAASKYSEGMRIKLTQTTDKYFIITKVADTVLTVYGGTDYDLVDAAITSPYYSTQKAPLGFPLDPTKWTIETKNTGNCSQSSPTSGTWYNLGSINIAIPIGVWRVYYQTIIMPQKANTTDLEMYVTLSTANNSQSDHDFTSLFSIYEAATGGANFRTFSLVNREKFLNLASKTTYYLNAKTNISGMTTIAFRGDQAPTIIRAVCAYL